MATNSSNRFPMEYYYAEWISLYMPPVLLTLGTLGNLMSLIIWIKSCMKAPVSTYVYLAVLSGTDIIVLFIGLFKDWMTMYSGYSVTSATSGNCKAFTVFGYVSTDFSVWLIIAVTTERYIAVCHPLDSPRVCTVNRTVKVIALLFGLLMALNSHLFFTAGLVAGNNNITDNDPCFGGGDADWNASFFNRCGAQPGYERLVYEVWPYIDLCMYSFLPFVLLLVLNSLIIQRVSSAATARRRYTLSQVAAALHGPFYSPSEVRMTVMLLTISFTFLLTTLPMNIVVILNIYWNAHLEPMDCASKVSTHARMELATSISRILMYSNHSINFYLYCATGKKFREQLKNLFACSILKPCLRPRSHSGYYGCRADDLQRGCYPLTSTSRSTVEQRNGRALC